jgi:hypothetical protein
VVTMPGAGDSGVGDGTWRVGPVRGAVSGPGKRSQYNIAREGSNERRREREMDLLV